MIFPVVLLYMIASNDTTIAAPLQASPVQVTTAERSENVNLSNDAIFVAALTSSVPKK